MSASIIFTKEPLISQPLTIFSQNHKINYGQTTQQHAATISHFPQPRSGAQGFISRTRHPHTLRSRYDKT